MIYRAFVIDLNFEQFLEAQVEKLLIIRVNIVKIEKIVMPF